VMIPATDCVQLQPRGLMSWMWCAAAPGSGRPPAGSGATYTARATQRLLHDRCARPERSCAWQIEGRKTARHPPEDDDALLFGDVRLADSCGP